LQLRGEFACLHPALGEESSAVGGDVRSAMKTSVATIRSDYRKNWRCTWSAFGCPPISRQVQLYSTTTMDMATRTEWGAHQAEKDQCRPTVCTHGAAKHRYRERERERTVADLAQRMATGRVGDVPFTIFSPHIQTLQRGDVHDQVAAHILHTEHGWVQRMKVAVLLLGPHHHIGTL
jgi:hypothetical protein